MSQYSWSPDSTQLIFYQSAPRDSAIYLYDVRKYAPPRRIVATESLDFPGWIDNVHVLNIDIRRSPSQPLHVEQIDTRTRQRTTLISVPIKRAWYGAARLSPDRRQLIMPGKYGECYMADLIQKEAQKVQACDNWVYWEPNSSTMLRVQYWSHPGGVGFLRTIGSPVKEAPIHMLPPQAPDGEYYLEAVSPDGRFLLWCRAIGDGRTRRLYLYDVEADRLVAPQKATPCGNSSGWLK